MDENEFRRHEWKKREMAIEEEEFLQKIRKEAEDALKGCTDGSCILRKQTGMHTNGGCRCIDDINEVISRYMEIAKRSSARIFLNKVFYLVAEAGRYEKKNPVP